MASKDKTPKHTTTKKKDPKVRVRKRTPCFDENSYGYNGRLIPIPDEFIEKTAEEFVEWALTNPNALTVDQFFIKKRISDCNIDKWKKNNKIFAECYEEGLRAIGNRREIGAEILESREAEHKAPVFRLDRDMIKFTMINYSKDWQKIHKFYSDLRKAENDERAKSILQAVKESSGQDIDKFRETANKSSAE